MNLDAAARAYVLMRLLVGATFASVPSLAQRLWLGTTITTDGDHISAVPLRTMGARDVALSAGALAAGRARSDPSAWLLAAALAEAADALAVLAVARQLPRAHRMVAAAGPAVLAVVGFALARRATR